MTETRTKKRRGPAETIDGNADMLREILLRLPAESLLRFKCVSKNWNSIISSAISDPKFCSNHTRINQKLSMLGAYYYFHRWELLERVKSVSFRRADQRLPTLAFLSNTFNLEPAIVHASKGLFLCWLGHRNSLAVCNLTTQKFTLLPPLPLSSSKILKTFAKFLHFEPEKSLHYKVVLVDWLYDQPFVDGSDDIRYQIDIYSSENRIWKTNIFRAPKDSAMVYMALWRGAIHWMVFKEFHIRFEIDTEELILRNFQHPRPIAIDDRIIRYFGECCRRFFLIEINRHDCEDFNILEMDTNFVWSVKYSVNMMPIRTRFNDIFMGENFLSWKFSVLCMVKEEEKEDFSLLMALPGIIISYDLKMETHKVLREFPPNEFFFLNHHAYNHAVAFHFIPTLSPTG